MRRQGASCVRQQGDIEESSVEKVLRSHHRGNRVARTTEKKDLRSKGHQ